MVFDEFKTLVKVDPLPADHVDAACGSLLPLSKSVIACSRKLIGPHLEGPVEGIECMMVAARDSKL